MAKQPSFLRPLAAEASKSKNLTLRLSAELAAKIDNLRGEAEAAGFVFDVNAVCLASLKEATESVSKELKKIVQEGAQR